MIYISVAAAIIGFVVATFAISFIIAHGFFGKNINEKK
jgi:hypothetical protein